MISQPEYPLLPDHTQLPESDGTFVKNFQEHPQSILLTDALEPVLQAIHPDGQYCIGQDCGIYWRVPTPPEPPERGAEAPDWFYVPEVPPTLGGQVRRSYVLWQEHIPPLVVLEFASGDGSEERDRTPRRGKFWIYERVIRPAYYGIYEVRKASVEVYELVVGHYRRMRPNERGHFAIEPLGVELGIWPGRYLDMELPWLRWWDAAGNLLPTGQERAQGAERRAEQAEVEARQERTAREQAELRTAILEERLRRMGLDPNALPDELV
ncbi:Uma2 family endonuclease [Gloeobacter violaceus]|uniref:Gll3130 protein n=1 Tax=Gloeobacter violaceus (strain ATCC 29082 / PCC 7421) TaxID=251221 RepID=Q7NGN8_GLOVI|nr:Uma2 family endonuclease [Gloeobacter violaceus]BAC91071.1 gll3130 [Gloeobacter violaceus PCC 7421]